MQGKQELVIPTGMADADPWERQPFESDEAWEAFLLYRDAGPTRSGKTVADQLNKSTNTVYGWATRYRWTERVRLRDLDEDRVLALERRQEIKLMAQRHGKMARENLIALSVPANALLRRISKVVDEGKLENWTTKELFYYLPRLASAMKTLVDIERLALGMSTENIALAHTGNADGATDQQQRIMMNPEASKLASKLFALLDPDDAGGLGEGDAGGAGEAGLEDPVEDAAPH